MGPGESEQSWLERQARHQKEETDQAKKEGGAVQPQTWCPSPQAEPEQKRSGGLNSAPPAPPLSHMGCWPQGTLPPGGSPARVPVPSPATWPPGLVLEAAPRPSAALGSTRSGCPASLLAHQSASPEPGESSAQTGCRSHRIMCIWAERGPEGSGGLGETPLPALQSKAVELAFLSPYRPREIILNDNSYTIYQPPATAQRLGPVILICSLKAS